MDVFLTELFSRQTAPEVLYLWVAILMFLNAVLMTPPSEYICLSAGILSFYGNGNLLVFILIASVCNLLGTSLWYLLGLLHKKQTKHLTDRQIKNAFFRKIFQIYTQHLHKIEQLFAQHSFSLLLLLRNVPIVRSISSYPAGRIAMPLSKFLLASGLGILIWVCLWTGQGYFLGQIALHYHWTIALITGLISLVMIKIVLSLTATKITIED